MTLNYDRFLRNIKAQFVSWARWLYTRAGHTEGKLRQNLALEKFDIRFKTLSLEVKNLPNYNIDYLNLLQPKRALP